MFRILLFALASLLAAAPAWACKCALRPYQDALADVEVAVEGKVGTIIYGERPDGPNVLASIRIRKRIKGMVPGRWVQVWTNGSPAACGYPFKLGQRAVFGLNRVPDGRWTTSSCIMSSLNQGR